MSKKVTKKEKDKPNYVSRENMVGKQVIDAEGMIVGSVSDISVDIEAKKIAFNVNTRSGAKIDIASEDVGQVGDVILLKKTVEAEVIMPKDEKTQVAASKEGVTSTAPSAPGKCKTCGYVNDPTAKFCIKCGTKLK